MQPDAAVAQANQAYRSGDLARALALAEAVVAERPDHAPMRQLAARLRCDPSSVTFLADRLVERGLIEVGVDPADRRRKRVALTPRGRQVRRDLLAAMTARSPLARLSIDDQRRLLDLLGRAVAAPAVDAGRPPGH